MDLRNKNMGLSSNIDKLQEAVVELEKLSSNKVGSPELLMILVDRL